MFWLQAAATLLLLWKADAAAVQIYSDATCTQASGQTRAVTDADLCAWDPTVTSFVVLDKGSAESARCIYSTQLEALSLKECATVTWKGSDGKIAQEFWRMDEVPDCLTQVVSTPTGEDAKDARLASTRRRRTKVAEVKEPPEHCDRSVMEPVNELPGRDRTRLIDPDLGLDEEDGASMAGQTLISLVLGLVFLAICVTSAKMLLPASMQPEENPLEAFKSEYDGQAAALNLTPKKLNYIRFRNVKVICSAFTVLGCSLVIALEVNDKFSKAWKYKCEACYEVLQCSCDLPWRACDVPAATDDKSRVGKWDDEFMCNLPDPSCYFCEGMGFTRDRDRREIKWNERFRDGRRDSCHGEVCMFGDPEGHLKRGNHRDWPTEYTIPNQCKELDEFIEVDCPDMSRARSDYIGVQMGNTATIGDNAGNFMKAISMLFFIPLALLTHEFTKQVEAESPVGDPVDAFIENMGINVEKTDRVVKAVNGICNCCSWTMRPCAMKCPIFSRVSLLTCYVLANMFGTAMNYQGLGSEPIIVGSVDRCDQAVDPHIAMILAKGAKHYVASPPGCDIDMDMGLAALKGVFVNFIPNIALPVIDFGLFLPMLTFPIFFDIYVHPVLAHVVLLLFRCGARQARGEAVKQAHKPVVEKLQKHCCLTEEAAENEWTTYLEPFLLSVDPCEIATVLEDLEALVEARILDSMERPVIEQLQKEPWNFSPSDAKFSWGLMRRLYEQYRAGEVNADIFKLVQAVLQGKLDVKQLIEKFVPIGSAQDAKMQMVKNLKTKAPPESRRRTLVDAGESIVGKSIEVVPLAQAPSEP
eukprot:TRINITY_DN75939_c0_g1_i1.p1 TRINITY_DN75939_c0_g1~~TRINITY_DN75939_c0_g1_i1.p1  ORF type:complete len:812 (+),score=103.59 TRINITY_DN75939_c0_g1_i1:91-2526(+)